MAHIQIAWNSLMVLISVGIISLSLVEYFKTRHRESLYFSLFLGNLFLIQLFNVIEHYLYNNLPGKISDTVLLVYGIPMIVTESLFIIVIVMFANSLFEIKRGKLPTIIFSFFSGIHFFVYLGYIVDIFTWTIKPQPQPDSPVQIILFYLPFVYFIGNGFVYLKKIASQEKRQFARNILISFSLVFPMLVIENMLNILFDYYTISIIMLAGIYIHYFVQIQSVWHVRRISLDVKSSAGAFEQYTLTRREQEIVQLLLSGFSNIEISEKLYISRHTVKNHLTAVYEKTGARNRYGLITLFK